MTEWKNTVPKWEGNIVEPPESKKLEGYKAGDRPPAAWENWFRNAIGKSVEENREELEKLGFDVENIDFSTVENMIAGVDGQLTAHKSNTSNPHEVTKAQVGLGNVINVKQASKVEFDTHKAESATIKHKAKEIGIEDVSGNFTEVNVEGAMSELFTNVSNGKQLVGNAITDVDDSVAIPTEPSFDDLGNAISGISTGKKWASGVSRVSSNTLPFRRNMVDTKTTNMHYFTVDGLDFKASVVVAHMVISTSGSSSGMGQTILSLKTPTTTDFQQQINCIEYGWNSGGGGGQFEIFSLNGNSYSNNTGFRLPIINPSISNSVSWIAFE